MNNKLFESVVSAVEDFINQAAALKGKKHSGYLENPKVRESAAIGIIEGAPDLAVADAAIAIVENRIRIFGIHNEPGWLEIGMELEEAINVVTANAESLGLNLSNHSMSGQSYRHKSELKWPLHVVSANYFLPTNNCVAVSLVVGENQYVSRALAYLLLSQNQQDIVERVNLFHTDMDAPVVQRSTLDS